MSAIEPLPDHISSPISSHLMATRPGFLAAAGIPVLIGLAAAARITELDWGLAALTLLGALVAHAGANVLNDVSDHHSGTDALNSSRVFPYTGGSRVIQNGLLSAAAMHRFGWSLFFIAALLGLSLAVRAGWHLLVIGSVGLLIGWAYSAPPLRLAARGLGEVAVGVAFGLVIPAGAAVIQSPDWPEQIVHAGSYYGLLTMLILIINQFPDIAADQATGKHNWVVRLGSRRAVNLYLAVLVAAASTLAHGVISGALPAPALIASVCLVAHILAWRQLRRSHDNPPELRHPIELTLAGTLLSGAMLAGLLAPWG